MGKEWLYWVGVGGGSAGGRGSVAGGMEEQGASAASAGCMCAVFQMFNLNDFQFPSTARQSEFKPDDSFLQEEATISKGVEAPRNSLELEEPEATVKAASMSLSLAMKQEEENLNFPVGIKIKTAKSRIPTSAVKSRTDTDASSEYSPGTKTPNLVARLMGLDLLPECTSPSNPKLKKKSHLLKNLRTENALLLSMSNRTFFDDDSSTGTVRSLPETPRISSSRRSDSEIHRLSLQLNKENTCDEYRNSAERGRSRRGSSRFKVLDENVTSPGHYTRQFVKQVKENVSRRVGDDITNRNRSEPNRRDENLVLLNPSKRNPTIFSRFGDDSTPSCSPKLRFLENTKSKPLAEANAKSPRNSTSSNYSPSLGISNPKFQIFQEQQPKKDCKKVASRGRVKSSSLKKILPAQGCNHGIKNKREEPFVRSPAKNKAMLSDKKLKKTPLSSDVFYITAPILLPVTRDPSPPVTKLPQNQSQVSDALASKRRAQLSSKPSQSYKLQLHTDKIFNVLENVEPDRTNGCANATSTAAEYENYIQKILRRTHKKWHSCSHPLDPTIFHYLELFQPTTGATSAAFLSRRSNRKLIFQLVDELLGEILRPRLGFMKLASPTDDHSSLVDELCEKIDGFPAANCEVLEDIDGLIERDLSSSPLKRSFEEEGNNIVCEIAGEITEWLMRETVADVGSSRAEESRQGMAEVTWRLPSGEMSLVGIIGPRSRGSSAVDTGKRCGIREEHMK